MALAWDQTGSQGNLPAQHRMKISEIEMRSAQLPLSAQRKGHIQVVEWEQEPRDSSYASETTVSLKDLLTGKYCGKANNGLSHDSADSQTDGSGTSDERVTIDNLWKVLNVEKSQDFSDSESRPSDLFNTPYN